MEKENEADTSSESKEEKARVEPIKSEKKEQAAGPSGDRSNKERTKDLANNLRENREQRKDLEQLHREGRLSASGTRRLEELRSKAQELGEDAKQATQQRSWQQIEESVGRIEEKAKNKERVDWAGEAARAQRLEQEGLTGAGPEGADPEKELAGLVWQEKVEEVQSKYPSAETQKEPRRSRADVAYEEQATEALRQYEQRLQPLARDSYASEEAYEAAAGERSRAVEAYKAELDRRWEEMKERSRPIYADPETAQMQGYELPPNLEKEGWEHTRNWFLDKLKFAEENYPDQSFESNWRIIYPLEQLINSMAVHVQEHDEFTDQVSGQRFKYEDLSKELNLHMQSRRSRHNHSYVWSRASGTEDFISAGHMLQTEYIDFLLKIDDRGVKVADKYRELEGLGRDYAAAKTELDRVNGEKRHKRASDENVQAAQDRVDALDKKIIELQTSNWAGRIATGLWCALGGAAHYDVSIQESGDFFYNRVQNFSDRAESDLRKRYDKLDADTQDKLVNTVAPAMDLKVETFWEHALDEQYKQLRGTEQQRDQAFRNFLTENKVKGIVLKKNKSGRETPGKWDFKNVDMSEAKLENLHLGQTGSNPFKLKDNQLMIYMLDVNDANGVRKLLWDPSGFLDRLDSPSLGAVYPAMKHLKGEKRSDWFKGAVQATIEINRDGLWDLPKPGFLTESITKKLFKRQPWGRDQTDIFINAFRNSGALNAIGGDELTDKYIGKKPTRIIRGDLFNWLKIIIGSLVKGYQAMEKATK